MSDQENEGYEEKPDWFEPVNRVLSPSRLNRYTKFVSSMKLALPLIAAGIVLILMIWPSTQPSVPPPRTATAMDSTMQAPTYAARDDKGQPFKVEADNAKQHGSAPNVMDLANPKGKIDLEGGSSIEGDASGAQYDQNKGRLNINGNLTLRHSSGAIFETQKAQVDMNAKTASGDAPVKVTGGFGEVNAAGFELQNEGKVVIFKGPSVAHLKLGSGSNPADAMKGLVPTSAPAAKPPASKL
jgi:lipopolysaccharide export system protein LptC